MPIYSELSLQLLVDLINQSNPSLPVPLTTTNVKYGTPAAITPTAGTIQNTTIKVTAPLVGPYIGNTTLTYRRVDLGTLLRSVPVAIFKFTAAAVGVAPYKISDLLPSINAKYGLDLQVSDIVDASLPASNTNAVPAIGLAAGTRNSSITVSASATSAGFAGSFTLYWVQAPEDISTMITVTSLENARVYPGNLNTVSSGLYVPDLDVFGIDFTDTINTIGIANLPELIANGAGLGTIAGGNLTIQQQFITLINALTGKTYNLTNPASTSMSLYGVSLISVTLPSAAVPEADTLYFNRALYLDLLPANSWGAGRMIFHYNV